MADNEREVLAYHLGGKVALNMPKPVNSVEDLCLAYTPGVAIPVKKIASEPETAFDYTAKGGVCSSRLRRHSNTRTW